MNQAVAQEQLCEKCGADVRPDSAFCYNCGAIVAAEDENHENKKVHISTEETIPQNDKDGFLRPGEMQNSKLKPASALNRRTRKFERKPVEIFWEPSEGTNDTRFLMLSLLVFIFALTAVVLALYMK